MALTLEDIAQLAGVSRATVSRVVNNYPFVRPEVRERVQRIVREHNYSPFPAAKLAPQPTRQIGVFLSSAAHSFLGDENTQALMGAMAQECERRGYFAACIQQDGVTDKKTLYRRVVASQSCDGFVVVAASAYDPLLPELEMARAKVALIGAHPRFASLPSVALGEAAAARAATARLLAHGRVGFISAPLSLIPAQNCLLGYKVALKHAGVGYDSGLVVECDASGEGLREALQKWMQMNVIGVVAATPGLLQQARQAILGADPAKAPQLALVELHSMSEIARAAMALILSAA